MQVRAPKPVLSCANTSKLINRVKRFSRQIVGKMWARLAWWVSPH
jgi:hypothetical protein